MWFLGAFIGEIRVIASDYNGVSFQAIIAMIVMEQNRVHSNQPDTPHLRLTIRILFYEAHEAGDNCVRNPGSWQSERAHGGQKQASNDFALQVTCSSKQTR